MLYKYYNAMDMVTLESTYRHFYLFLNFEYLCHRDKFLFELKIGYNRLLNYYPNAKFKQ